MSESPWCIERLINDEDVSYEQQISKEPNILANWLKYYRFKSSKSSTTFQQKVFILERAVKQLPRSYKLWKIYLDLMMERLRNANYSKARSQFVMVNRLFERSLQLLNKAPIIWIEYLEYLIEKQYNEVTLIRRTFNDCLYNLPITQHHLIWPKYIKFADDIGGMTGAKIYLKYLQYATPESLQGLNNEHTEELGITIDDIISKFIEFGDLKEATKLFEYVLANPDRYVALAKSPLQLWVEYIDLLIDSVSKNKRNTVNYNEYDYFFESLVNDALQKFPDQIGKFYSKLTFYFVKRKKFFKVRYYFDKGLKSCVTVKDFTMIYDSYTEFEESLLTHLSEKLRESDDDPGLTNELDLRMSIFEKLINDRPFLLNDMMLRQDSNNLDEWFKRIDLYKNENNVNKMLNTFATALKTINPLKAHSLANKKEYNLPNLWVTYANVYASQNDIKTANLIFSKSVKSQFQNPDDLATLYIEWSDLHMKNGNEIRAIEIVENICIAEQTEVDYNDSSVDIHLRVHKSIKLWSFYLDLLESLVETGEETNEIEKVIDAYNKTINLKIASALTIINFANFLEELQFFERSFSVYETGIRIFKDSKIRFEIWNIYLSKVIKHDLNIERIRDLFEQCLNGSGVDGDYGCPAYLCRPVYLLYSHYEQEKGWTMRSIKILKQGIQKLNKGLNEESITKTEKDTIIKDKFDMYLFLISKISTLNDNNELRKAYESILKDDQLSFRNLVYLSMDFIDFESNLKEYNRVRSLFKFLCRLSNPESESIEPVWKKWESFELKFGNESTFKDMLRFKRTVSAEYENDQILKDSLNPMGFVKSSTGPKVSSLTPVNTSKENNPDSIDLDMDM